MEPGKDEVNMVGWSAGCGKSYLSGAGSAGRKPTAERQQGAVLRLHDRYPYSRFWAIWDDQDLVAVVVYKKGAAELLRRLQAHAPPPASARAAVPAAPTAAERPGERRRTVQGSRRLAQG